MSTGLVYITVDDPVSILLRGRSGLDYTHLGFYVPSTRSGRSRSMLTLICPLTYRRPSWASSGCYLDRLESQPGLVSIRRFEISPDETMTLRSWVQRDVMSRSPRDLAEAILNPHVEDLVGRLLTQTSIRLPDTPSWTYQSSHPEVTWDMSQIEVAISTALTYIQLQDQHGSSHDWIQPWLDRVEQLPNAIQIRSNHRYRCLVDRLATCRYFDLVEWSQQLISRVIAIPTSTSPLRLDMGRLLDIVETLTQSRLYLDEPIGDSTVPTKVCWDRPSQHVRVKGESGQVMHTMSLQGMSSDQLFQLGLSLNNLDSSYDPLRHDVAEHLQRLYETTPVPSSKISPLE